MATKDDNQYIFGTAFVAGLFGISERALTNWREQGAPQVSRGKWDIREVMKWRFDGGLKGKESPEVRKLKAEAELKEIKKQQEAIRLAVTEGRYIPVDQVTRDLRRLFGSIKNKLMSIGHKAAVEVNSLDAESAVTAKRVIDDVVREALEDMSKGDIYGPAKT